MTKDGFKAMKARVIRRMVANGATEKKLAEAFERMKIREGLISAKTIVLTETPKMKRNFRFTYTESEKRDIKETARIRGIVSG